MHDLMWLFIVTGTSNISYNLNTPNPIKAKRITGSVQLFSLHSSSICSTDKPVFPEIIWIFVSRYRIPFAISTAF